MFNPLEGDAAIIVQGGIYKSTTLHEWSGRLFVKVGSGFAQLKHDGTTTKDGVRVEHMETDRKLFKDRFGRLATKNHEGYAPIQLSDNGKLLLN